MGSNQNDRGRDPLDTLAKILGPGSGLTPAKTAAPHRWTTGVVQTVNGDGTAGITIDGGSVVVQADIIGSMNLIGGNVQTVQVLVAENRLLIHGVCTGAEEAMPGEMYLLGSATTPMVGLTLPTGLIRTISFTYVGTVTTGFGLSEVTIPLTGLSPNLTEGYNVVLSSGDISTTIQTVAPIPLSSTLTSLVANCATSSGGTVPTGTNVRVNGIITGA